MWSYGASKSSVIATLSFNIPLAQELDEDHVHFVGASNVECPGSFSEPVAEPGNLCVYATSATGEIGGVFNSGFNPGASKNGAMIVVAPTIAEPEVQGFGSWAVTAP